MIFVCKITLWLTYLLAKKNFDLQTDLYLQMSISIGIFVGKLKLQTQRCVLK